MKYYRILLIFYLFQFFYTCFPHFVILDALESTINGIYLCKTSNNIHADYVYNNHYDISNNHDSYSKMNTNNNEGSNSDKV